MENEKNNKLKNYKDTLLMPQTAFEMRANLVVKEPYFRQFWEENNIYHKVLQSRKNNQSFILHDGPPYANGDLHFGHALNKILKDIVVRYKSLQGFYSPFICGWDTHGLPIENKMLNELKMTKDDLDPITLRKKATEYAQSQIANQKSQFKLMQLFTDFNIYYRTFDPEYEANQLKVFKHMILNKWIYKGLKPIYWSPTSQSALAEAEVEYKTISSPQIIVKFNLITNNLLVKNTSLLIMTTTPWTLIANAAVAVGKEIEYSVVQVQDEQFIIASKLVNEVAQSANWIKFKIIKTLLGKDLTGLFYVHPIDHTLNCPVVLGHHVITDEGTGLVHIAPLFGEDDYLIGQENNLRLIMHVNDDGTLNDNAGLLTGHYYLKVNKIIIEQLSFENNLISNKIINHSYPHDWRTRKPIIYRATPQWFFSIKQIKPKIHHALKNVNSFPHWGVERIKNMIDNRTDWTISRQRTWGVPIIVFYDINKNIVVNEEILNYVIDLVSKQGSDVWWLNSVDDLLPPQYRNQGFTKETDIMDVWFDSGCSFLSPQLKGLKPDLYLEGNDQYRGWFNSSLINGVAYQNKSPFNTLVSHGFVLDDKNQKMSKSLGNVLDPLLTINKHGADILRLWVASTEFSSDVVVSHDIIDQVANVYRHLRSKIRFMIGNLFDFNYEQDKVELTGLDLLINERLNNLKYEVKNHFDNYKFHHALREINQFILDTSSYYFEINKDTLYIEQANSKMRRAVQTNLYNIVNFILRSLSPIMPTTCEEAYQQLNKNNQQLSIFLEIEEFAHQIFNVEEKKWTPFFNLKNLVYKLIEDAKKNQLIRRSNEVWLTLEQQYSHFKDLDLAKLLMVGKVTFGDKNEVKTFSSIKCQRCWNHFEKSYITNNHICRRCDHVIGQSHDVI